ncbi:MAG: RNA polymerase-binding protein DksA, partial [Alphaproteobacteria bacterium]|nr:RNA polymerase-binding protein DksA [Alphaproteobacteria bacterium]
MGSPLEGISSSKENFVLDTSDSFMSPAQLEYFRNKLISWKNQLMEECSQTIDLMKNKEHKEADDIDLACNQINEAIELRTRERERKLIHKINLALRRIEDGSYGYCEETGEPINLRRLDARPIATFSIDAQERHERKERFYRDLLSNIEILI